MSTKSDWKSFYDNIGQEIRRKRSEAELTLDQVAKKVQLSSGAVLHRYETGERTPPLHILFELGNVLADNYYFFIPQDYMSISSQDMSWNSSILSNKIRGGIHNRIYKLLDEIDDEKILMGNIIRELSTSLNIGVIANFYYDWYRSELLKIDEYIAPIFQGNIEKYNIDKVEESYNVWRELYVTELAWAIDSDDRRFITDYERIRSTSLKEVNPASFEWHKKVLGNVLSTMYAIIGKSEKRYAIRCFNRSDHINGLLDRIQYWLLTELCDLISVRMDIRAKERSLRNIRDLHSHLNDRLYDIRVAMELIRDKVFSEGAKSMAILWSRKDITYLSDGFVYGEYIDTFNCKTGKKLSSNSLCDRVYSNNESFILDVFQEAKDAEKHTIDGHINQLNKSNISNIGRLLIFPFRLSKDRKGAMIIPVETGPDSGGFTKIDIPKAIPEEIEVLNTYSSVIASVLRGHLERSGGRGTTTDYEG